ncbi:hypothetical protein BYT27DRAFT_7252287 [Phlegmacium glaucopus]|nr:hypothetical protein BYT27DRAFT_7252287 [Phlegmacium glaucopus]
MDRQPTKDEEVEFVVLSSCSTPLRSLRKIPISRSSSPFLSSTAISVGATDPLVLKFIIGGKCVLATEEGHHRDASSSNKRSCYRQLVRCLEYEAFLLPFRADIDIFLLDEPTNCLGVVNAWLWNYLTISRLAHQSLSLQLVTSLIDRHCLRQYRASPGAEWSSSSSATIPDT